VPLVIFPNIPEGTLNQIAGLRPSRFGYLAKEDISGSQFGITLLLNLLTKADPTVIASVRSHFSPEINLPPKVIPTRFRNRNSKANLTRYLLDWDQERAIKLDLALSPDVETTVSAEAPRLVTGVAGSGKSLVLLYRAALVTKLSPEKRCLILTHNKPLIYDLERRLRCLTKSANIECIHFQKWCWHRCGSYQRILRPSEKEAFVAEAAAGTSNSLEFPITFLSEEFEWIKDYDLHDLDRYLQSKRTGRGRRLNEQQRRAVFTIFEGYQERLIRNRLLDWSDLPSLVLKKVRIGELNLPTYDYVFVDEAQFFAPVWLKIVQFLVKPDGGQLMLAADPTQGFLKRRESWAACGMNMRGRTVRLERAYRNSKGILEFAVSYYRNRLQGEDEDVNLPTPDQMDCLPPGPPPEHIFVSAPQDEIVRACNEVRLAIANGVKASDILIIVPDPIWRSRVISTLNREHKIAMDAQRESFSDSVRVCSINAATGIESPIVLLLGCSDITQRESALTLNDEDRQDLIRDNTRRVYMAMTRATQRLIVFSRD
jgi:superfamily I DNA/RNA helicase